MKYLAVASIGLLVLFAGCAPTAPATGSPKLEVVASFYPLAHFAEQVGDDLVHVTSVTPSGVEPHDYEPSPQDIVKVQHAKVFLSNGSGVDSWADKVFPDLQAKGIEALRMSDHFTLREAAPNEENAGEEHPSDPHIWLDPILAKNEVELIRDTLVKADPIHAEQYTQNAGAYLAELEALDAEYRAGLQNCAVREIVTSHDAFEYLGKRYSIKSIALSGISPEEEPSPKVMADIADQARTLKIKYIFFETLASPKLSEAIAQEIGAQSLVLNPIEGLTDEERAQGETYRSMMEKNLQNLRTAMQCQ